MLLHSPHPMAAPGRHQRPTASSMAHPTPTLVAVCLNGRRMIGRAKNGQVRRRMHMGDNLLILILLKPLAKNTLKSLIR